MSNKELTDWEALEHIDLIKKVANQVWGHDVQFGEMKVLDSPYPEFEWPMRLYEKTEILLAYDRSTLDIGIPKNGKYVLMSEFANKEFFRGMVSTQPENLLSNFRLLDEIAKKIR